MTSYTKPTGGAANVGGSAPLRRTTETAEASEAEAKSAKPVLKVPDTTRARLPDPVSPAVGSRGIPSAVTVRSGPWSKRGKRMARFRTERLSELKPREAEALHGAMPVVNHHIERLRPRANDPARAEMLPESAEALTAALQSALQGARNNRLAGMVEDFRQSGFHHLLTETLVRGKLTSSMAKAQRDRLKGEIDARTLSGDAVKRGFLVFDGLAQRLSLLKPDFEYDVDGASRVFLETYAGSFHRG